MRVIADIPDVLYQQLESFAQREQIPIDPTFSRLFKTKNNIYEKKHRETAKLDFVDQ